MKTDIVERLRAIVMKGLIADDRLVLEAAIELERLRHVEADHKQLLERLRQLLAE